MTFCQNKKIIRCLVCIVLINAVFEIGIYPVWSSSNETIYLGHSKIELTPRVGTPLAGYGRRKGKPSQDVNDPIYVRAIALTRKNDSVVFASVDLVLVDKFLRSEVVKKVQKRIPFSDEQLVLFATHTHSGPGAVGKRFWQRFIMGKFQREIFDEITIGIAQAIVDSLRKPDPISVEYGEVQIDELTENRMDEKLQHPSWLRILQFRGDDRSIIARMVGMAAHPTILSSSSFHLSADYPGVLTRRLESEAPGSVALFINGAAADIRPRIDNQETEFLALETYGESVYQKIAEIAWKKATLDGVWCNVYQETRLPPVKIRWARLKIPRLLASRLFPRQSIFQTVRMGPFVFSAIPAEIGSEIGVAIEKQFRAMNLTPMIIGYANDYLGYAVPRRYYHEPKKYYEARASFYGEKMDWFIQEQIDEQLTSIMTDEEKLGINRDGNLAFSNGLPVLKLYGDSYNRGFEEGRLLKDEINQAYKDIARYFRSHLPIPGLNRLLINKFMDKAWRKLEPYISYSEYQQMRGLADGADIPIKHVLRLHAVPEIHATGCSNGAYWGGATKDTRLIALRNLDWNRDIGVHNYAAVKVHTPSGKNTYVNIGYYGFVGVLSGLNESGISIGEIGATSSDESMRGIPMHFLLKRVLSQANSLDEAISIFEQGELTQGFNYVIASAFEKKAAAIEATHRHIAVFKDNDPRETAVAYSMPIEDAIFRGDPAMDPTIRDLQWASHGNPKSPGLEFPKGPAYEIRYMRHGELIKNYYGQIDVEIVKSIAKEITPKSNIQSVIYAFPEFWVANAKGDLRATDCPYHHFNFDALKN